MKPRICFATPGVLPMLRGDAAVYGGSELRSWRFARGLADLGFPVSLIGTDRAGLPPEALGPVHLVTEKEESGRGGPFGWLLRPRRVAGPAELWRKAAADLYVAFGVGEYTAQLAAWGQANGRPVVLMAGSDADFAADYAAGNTARNPYGSRCDLCYDAIMRVSAIVVQTETQQRLVRERFARDATAIANPVTVPDREPSKSDARYFLWIGKSDRVKRPDLFAELARLCPELRFRAIVNPVDRAMFDALRATAPGNLDTVERVEPRHMPREFASAIALVNTSEFEGLSNAMLEAGAHGVPVLSLTVDPDGMLSQRGGGFAAAGRMDELATALRRFAADPDVALACGMRLYQQVRAHHSAAARIAELGEFLLRLARPADSGLTRETA
jgi:glycosyltransferase involved in cell wall biosynthesis